jgi:hypothetical protein
MFKQKLNKYWQSVKDMIFIRLRRNTLQLAAGIKGKVNRAEAHQSEGGLIPLYHFTLEWLRRNSALIPRSLLWGASF